MIRNAKAENPRDVELVCLKNRFGISSYSCQFRYYAKYDWFDPNMDDIDLSMVENDPEGYTDLPEEYINPFA